MATKADKNQRVDEVLTLRLAGAAFREIRQLASEKGWGVSDRQIRRYIAESDKLLAEDRKASRRKRINLHLAQRRLLLNRTLEVGDYGTALRVLTDSAKLEDLYPSAKPAPPPAGGSFTLADAAAVLNALKAARRPEDVPGVVDVEKPPCAPTDSPS